MDHKMRLGKIYTKVIVALVVSLIVIIISCNKESKPTGEENLIYTSPTPLTDFGSGTFRGHSGGLYPNGSNIRPENHNSEGISIAKSIKPLNTSGNIDETGGKIVWISIGMSNTSQETSAFIPIAQAYSNKNQKLLLVDGAEGGQDITKINIESAPYWQTVNNRLTAAGVTAFQVQVIWYKEAEIAPRDTAFDSYPNSLKDKFILSIQMLKSKFPNLKLVYLSSRTYAGWATGTLNPEPYAWFSGWAVKRLIEEQINGASSLNYKGSQPQSAWLAWGPYFWTDGTKPRDDGVSWLQSDYQADGVHPSNSGRLKIANMLLQFFSTDPTSTPWFLKQ
jgi:hypothetical protein